MKTIRLTEKSKHNLTGKTIYNVGDDYITLSDGMRIYLSEDEIADIGGEFIPKTIELPDSFFPYHMVEVIRGGNETLYPLTIFGFDGNIVYEATTNTYELRDNADKDYLREIGQYLCNNFKTI